MFLSICIPSYNREKELDFLLETIPVNNKIEIIIVDDGSIDNTRKVVDKYQKIHSIKYFYQNNKGRSFALKRSIENANAKYTMLMDSDDYFIDNWYLLVLDGINTIERYSNSENVKSLVFGVKIIKEKKISVNLPPNGLSNLIKFRVESNNNSDCKEIVDTKVLKDSLYCIEAGIRRVPTSLLWLKVAEKTNCLCVSSPIVVKEYLPGGMSDKILELKVQNPLPMVELNELLVMSNSYQSLLYRIKAILLWGRYYHHILKNKPLVQYFWQNIALVLSYPVYVIDRIRLHKRQ